MIQIAFSDRVSSLELINNFSPDGVRWIARVQPINLEPRGHNRLNRAHIEIQHLLNHVAFILKEDAFLSALLEHVQQLLFGCGSGPLTADREQTHQRASRKTQYTDEWSCDFRQDLDQRCDCNREALRIDQRQLLWNQLPDDQREVGYRGHDHEY